jgi:hypothetical protein
LSELENSSSKNLFIEKRVFDQLIISLKKRFLNFSDEITARKISNILFYITKMILSRNSIVSKFTSGKKRN